MLACLDAIEEILSRQLEARHNILRPVFRRQGEEREASNT